MGTTEVTNAQYAAFLNVKAATDPRGLYNVAMGTEVWGGITCSGSDGSYTYSPRPNMADKPVVYVSWYDSLRFANWLNNGQGDGDTETGAYTILFEDHYGGGITRNTGATWFLPSRDEWYKAAYYQPAAEGGDSDDYWYFATRSNSIPTIATANAVGDISNPGPNVVNYERGADWNGENGNLTTVGSAGPLSESFYGTSDQAGNAIEWVDTLVPRPVAGPYPAYLGGVFAGDYEAMVSIWQYRWYAPALGEFNHIGFRVATIPEPTTYVMASLGLVSLFVARRRRRSL